MITCALSTLTVPSNQRHKSLHWTSTSNIRNVKLFRIHAQRITFPIEWN